MQVLIQQSNFDFTYPYPMLEIVNIVTSGSLGQRDNLMDLAYAIPEFSYDPESYHGGYLKLTKYTVTIYSSGKIHHSRGKKL